MKIVTAIYAAVLGLTFLVLSFKTLLLRRRLQIAVGDGGDPKMLRAMRVHANFAEYTPLCLFLIYLLETLGANHIIIHILSLILVSGRVLHAYGVSYEQENYKFRVFGTSLTFTALLGASIGILLMFTWEMAAS